MLNHYLANTLNYDAAKCINCGLCLAVCPHGVFAANGKVVRVARAEVCMECGACQLNCPTQAIAVESGVGCAEAMIYAALTGRKEATCGGDEGGATCCGGAAAPTMADAKAGPSRFSWLGWLRSPASTENCSASGGQGQVSAKRTEC